MSQEDKKSILISSFGGCGTTMLMKFLSKYNKYDVIENDKLKHYPKPPNLSFVKKAVYIFGNPFDTVCSHFRRKSEYYLWPTNHCRNMCGKWSEISPSWELKDYLDNNEDLFLMEEQFDNWTNPKKNIQYLILLVRYEKLWENLDKIFRFLEIPLEHIDRFPKKEKRKSSYINLPKLQQEKLNQIYGKLYEKIKKHPDIRIIGKL